MAGYSKLFSSIVTSSIWCEEDTVLRVWIAMLATCNANGEVEGSIPGFASLARVTVEEMRRAIEILSSPDPDSRTPDNEGRRIATYRGGWRILNYGLYRNGPQDKDGSHAARQKKYRERHPASRVTAPASAYASVPGDESIEGTRTDGEDWAGPLPGEDA